jgi:hypothetical protein
MCGNDQRSFISPSRTVVRLGYGTPAGVLTEAGALPPVRRLLSTVAGGRQADLLARRSLIKVSICASVDLNIRAYNLRIRGHESPS